MDEKKASVGMRVTQEAASSQAAAAINAMPAALTQFRCPICGRPRAFIRQFGICRICFRNMALRGELPGVRKSSW